MEVTTIEVIKIFESAVFKHPDISVKRLFRLMYELLGVRGFFIEQKEFETYYRAVCKRGERK